MENKLSCSNSLLKKTLELGSVHIASKLFLIRAWSPFLEQQVGSLSSVPIWIILRDVSLHLWNEIGFSRITSLAGKPIMTDAPTAMKTRMAFARVCVEIDANCTFPTKLPFQIDDKKYEVRAEYPWKPTSCCHCKSFGHSNDKCAANQVRKYTKKWKPKKTFTSSDVRGTTLAGTSQEAEVRVENQNKNDDLQLLEKVNETVSEIVDANSMEVTTWKKKMKKCQLFRGRLF
ncbi:uncharacterized protein LOC113280286 [Papaver somniferum]|uniref:uncharacterized protein LOC113280286 n=1 Tax=Papaver somniferum TaxID=3469 RepID=UPI000E701E65|nr:uncharacterized protein LOC113280286 [Papaver somniferum]